MYDEKGIQRLLLFQLINQMYNKKDLCRTSYLKVFLCNEPSSVVNQTNKALDTNIRVQGTITPVVNKYLKIFLQ